MNNQSLTVNKSCKETQFNYQLNDKEKPKKKTTRYLNIVHIEDNNNDPYHNVLRQLRWPTS